MFAFASFTAVGMIALIRWRGPGEVMSILHAISPGVLVLLLALVTVDFILGGLRYRLFFDGKLFPRVSLWHCVRANWANMFMGAVTPAQTGGGPALLYVLCRRGASLSQAVLVSLINLVATLSFFAIGGVVALALMPRGLLSQGTTMLLGVIVATISLVVIILLVAITVRSRRFAAQQHTATCVSGQTGRADWLGRTIDWVRREFHRVRVGVRAIAREGKIRLLWTGVGTTGLYINKYVIGLVLARALQDHVSPAFIGLQLLQNVALYFAPTPGAAGLAEASSGLLLTEVLAAEFVVVWVIGWRFFTTIIATALGLVVTIGEARRHMIGVAESPAEPGTAPC